MRKIKHSPTRGLTLKDCAAENILNLKLGVGFSIHSNYQRSYGAGCSKTKRARRETTKEAETICEFLSIAKGVCEHALTAGWEFRFLRHELNLSQAALAALLGSSEQNVANWEKGKSKMQPAADRLIRLMYREKIDGTTPIAAGLERLAEMESEAHLLVLSRTDPDGWQPVAA